MKWCLVVWLGISLMMNDAQCLFLDLTYICVYLEKCFLRSFALLRGEKGWVCRWHIWSCSPGCPQICDPSASSAFKIWFCFFKFFIYCIFITDLYELLDCGWKSLIGIWLENIFTFFKYMWVSVCVCMCVCVYSSFWGLNSGH